MITAAAGQPVRSVDDLSSALRAAAAAGSLDLTVLRGTEERSVRVTFGAAGPAATQA